MAVRFRTQTTPCKQSYKIIRTDALSVVSC